MIKLLAAFLILSGGAIWSGALHRATQQAQERAWSHFGELKQTTNLFADSEETATLLRKEVAEKKNQLNRAALPPNDNAEWLALLEGGKSEGQPAAWARLRKEMGIGWS